MVRLAFQLVALMDYRLGEGGAGTEKFYKIRKWCRET